MHDDRGKYVPDNRGLYVHVVGPDGAPALPYNHQIGPNGPNGGFGGFNGFLIKISRHF